MKKLAAVFLILTVVIYLFPAAVSAYEAPKYLRIGIYYGSNARSEYTLECASDLKMCMGRIYCQKSIICFTVQVHNFPK